MSTFDYLGLVSCCNCNDLVVKQVLNDPKLFDLYKKLLKRVIPGDKAQRKCLHKIVCRECLSDGTGGSYGPEPTQTKIGLRNLYTIVVCCGENGTKTPIRTLYHEFQHAAETCNGFKPSTCRQQTCFEARARYCSGMSKKQSKDEAHKSSRSHENCDGFSDTEIKDLAKSCTLDKKDCLIQRPAITTDK
jgi:hypothetical protein